MKLERLPLHKQQEVLDEAHAINVLVDEWLLEGKAPSADTAAEDIIEQREMLNAYKGEFGNGWAEMIARKSLAKHPAVESVEEAPRETNDDRKTDMFVKFKDGPLVGVQFTVMGFEDRDNTKMRKTLLQKAADVINQGVVTYYGKEEVPLTMVHGNSKEFFEAFIEWESNGKKGSPSDYARKDFPEKAIDMMIKFLELKAEQRKNPKDREVAKAIIRAVEKALQAA